MNNEEMLQSYIKDSLYNLDLVKTKLIMMGMYNYVKVVDGLMLSLGGIEIIVLHHLEGKKK
jgi:hypothetical protein